jgi:hypothetical protein
VTVDACRPPHEGVRTTVSHGPPPLPVRTEQRITVGFSTTNKVMSKAIRWVTRSPCSHAWFCFNQQVVGVRQTQRMVAQAEWFGYEARPRWRWDKQNILVAEFELVGPDASNAVHAMLEQYLGSKYDYRAAALAGIWRLCGRSIKGKFQDPVKLMCSEGVIRMLGHAGYHVAEHFDPETTSPKRLMVRCFQWPTELKLVYALPSVLDRYGGVHWKSAEGLTP